MAIERDTNEWRELVNRIGQAVDWDFFALNDLYLDCLTDVNADAERKQIEPFLRKIEGEDDGGHNGYVGESKYGFRKSSLKENFARLNRAAKSRLIETSIDDVLNMKIGSQIDWKFGLITRTIVRVDEDIWEIHETSGRWVSAEVNREQLIQLMNGELDIMDLDWE